MKRVVVFSRDPGGANAVIPLVSPLRRDGYRVALYGKDFALDRYRTAGLDGSDTAELSADGTDACVRELIRKESPDFVITGTSADDDTEKAIWRVCEAAGIPSMAVVDQWCNYGLRFSRFGVDDIAGYDADKKHVCLPTLIIALDDFARREMVAEGLPDERIAVCGQPYFEAVLAQRVEGRRSLSGVAQPGEFVVVFASEPITKTYGEQEALRYWGYTEKTILASLVQSLETVAVQSSNSITLAIRPHPKEGLDHFDKVLTSCSRIRWRFDRNNSPWASMQDADLVCGMSSMFLVESVILGRPALSIQIGLRRDDPSVLARRGIMPTVLSEQELVERLRRIIVLGEREARSFEVIRDPVRRIIAEMEKKL